MLIYKKCPDILKRVEMVERNKDGNFSFPDALWIISVCKNHPEKIIKLMWHFCIVDPFTFEVMLLQNSSFLTKKKSSALAVELIMIAQVDKKNSLVFKW